MGAEDKNEMLVKGPHVIVEKTENTEGKQEGQRERVVGACGNYMMTCSSVMVRNWVERL